MENNIKSIIFDQYTISKVGSTDWQKDDSAVHFWAALHFYSVANFVALWLKGLQMISDDFT